MNRRTRNARRCPLHPEWCRPVATHVVRFTEATLADPEGNLVRARWKRWYCREHAHVIRLSEKSLGHAVRMMGPYRARRRRPGNDGSELDRAWRRRPRRAAQDDPMGSAR